MRRAGRSRENEQRSRERLGTKKLVFHAKLSPLEYPNNRGNDRQLRMLQYIMIAFFASMFYFINVIVFNHHTKAFSPLYSRHNY